MGTAAVVSVCAWIILNSGVCSGSLPEITDGKFIADCVAEHNRARSSVSPPASNMLYMTWDEALAITARAWARHCEFEHNPLLKDVQRVHPTFPSVGENIWVGSPASSFDVTKAIQSWVDEKQHYNYNSNHCTDVCGHYTQVVWANSYKVGCAVQLCPNGVKSYSRKESAIFVCNYATAGNMNGRKPYESQGAACSGCKGTCEKNLCRNPERDSQKKYSWTPDSDPVHASATSGGTPDGATSPTSDSKYWTVVIARPVALLFTFITAYAVHHFYPDVFCYE